MHKVIATIPNCDGNEIPIVVLRQEDGLLSLWKITCFSSRDHNLGTCNCINHSATEETLISTDEVIQRFGKEALDGFQAPGREQMVFDAFGIELAELETFIRVSYMLDSDPLPALRSKGNVEVFAVDQELISSPDVESGTIMFLVNSRGQISVRKVV